MRNVPLPISFPEVVVPGLLTAGDLPDLAAALAPKPMRLEALVDGFNRPCTPADSRELYRPARQAYRHADADARLILGRRSVRPAPWLLKQLAAD